jgi:hypothetical protein
MVLLLAPILAGCLSSNANGPDDSPIAPGGQAVESLWREAVDLGSVARPGAAGTSCTDSAEDGDCGLGEPSIEVDGAGTIYVSAVCCVTVPPPVYVSRDGGITFNDLTTPGGIREDGQGVEGDFAIDGLGRVYFSDIDVAASFQVTVWEADGTFIRHVRWPAPPLVDRDWIRAEGDGIAYYVYNTGGDTNVYKTIDAGETWSPAPLHSTGFGLGNAAIWPGHALCIAGGNDNGLERVDCSLNQGTTWKAETTATPGGGSFPVPTFDEVGNLYVVTNGDGITYSSRTNLENGDADWMRGPSLNFTGTHRMPWAAGGGDGDLVVAWYGSNDTEIGPDSEWFLWTAIVEGANTMQPTVRTMIADPTPVFIGNLGRDLLDFLQVDFGPDGAIHVAYSQQIGPYAEGLDGDEERLRYVRSEPLPELMMDTFWLGPA